MLIQSARRVLSTDFVDLATWCSERGKTIPDESLFPRTGFIIDGIAAGFIYFTDSAVAIIDCYISNPNTESKTRSNALNAITDALITCAKFNRCKLIKCDTKIEAVKRRALEFGFKPTGAHESFAKGL